MSKAVTALCVATLIQDQKLRFEDPIGPLLAPVFMRLGEPADERLRSVTVAQLLTHRGGLPYAFADGNRFAPGALELLQQRPLNETTAGMLIPAIFKLHLPIEPGSKHSYSNVGYLLLGQIIETVTGKSYEAECGRRVLAKAGISEPKLDEKWGRLLHATAGWALSGPEYLAFARLLTPRRNGLLTPAMHSWLRSLDGKWTDDHKVEAYTLGVRVRPVANASPDIYHGGGWLWHGRYSEKRGALFVLRNDGVAWFASYDGVHGDTEPEAVNALYKALARTAFSVSSWSEHDLFAEMGVKAISSDQ
jgi:CubicO group peptidase (beta-lactamase class C family)